jgi:hypothetical protein
MDPIKITPKTYYSPSDSAYGFFVDGEFLYYSFDEDLAKEFLEDIIKDLERKFKKENPLHRTFIERPNAWTAILQKARDGIILQGKPRCVHTVELKRAQKLLKCIEEN